MLLDIIRPTLERNGQSPVFVAVIDDEKDLACLFKDALSQIDGIRIFAFSDPKLALEHFQINHQHYNVVITVHRMPEMTGIELLSKIKDVSPAATRILMSAFEIQDQQFQECDCVDKFLQKPIHMIDLINEVRKLIANPKEVQIVAQRL
jgi:DNA-binding NtrC family response regulator